MGGSFSWTPEGRDGEISATAFYDSRAWRKLRREVLKDDNNECQICKTNHKHRQAVVVHHVFHLEEYPQYGLTRYIQDPATGEWKRNLISVCKECHETVCHPERMRDTEARAPLTEERW